ncbi:MAG: hypothetical protein E5W78_00310 [Mesorhizobium sp.]|nr:MAG: hypothetical protein E5W78_00310 [Mesorhizobium sp.]
MKAENVTEIETDAVHTTLGAIFVPGTQSLELVGDKLVAVQRREDVKARRQGRRYGRIVRSYPPSEGNVSAQNGP